DALDRAGVRVEHGERVLARRRRRFDHRFALAGSGDDVALNELAQLDEITGMRRGIAEHVADGDDGDGDAALEIGAADAAAARLYKQAHGVLQTVDIAADPRAEAAHRDLAVRRIFGQRVVPLGTEARRPETGGERGAKP